MFRISYLVNDDDLVKAIRIVTPIAINLNVNNVPNGEATLVPPSVLLRNRPYGVKSLDVILQTLKERNLTSFKSSMFREVIKQAGMNPASYSHYLKELIKYGCLSKLGKGMNVTYQVVDKA